MQAVVKKVVYSFRYRLSPGKVGRGGGGGGGGGSHALKSPHVISHCFFVSVLLPSLLHFFTDIFICISRRSMYGQLE